MLSDFDCADLSEASLDELVGIRCVVANESRGHSYDTKVAGKWRSINAALDFNGDGAFEKSQSGLLRSSMVGAKLWAKIATLTALVLRSFCVCCSLRRER
jgi:hypothetical protein